MIEQIAQAAEVSKSAAERAVELIFRAGRHERIARGLRTGGAGCERQQERGAGQPDPAEEWRCAHQLRAVPSSDQGPPSAL